MGRGMGCATRGGGAVMGAGKGKGTGFKAGGRVAFKDGGEVHPRAGTQGLAKRGYKDGGFVAAKKGKEVGFKDDGDEGQGRVKKAMGGMMGAPAPGGAPPAVGGGLPPGVTPQMLQAAMAAQQGQAQSPGAIPPPPPGGMAPGGAGMGAPPPGPGTPPPPGAPPGMKTGGLVKKALGGMIGNSMGAPGAGAGATGALQTQGRIIGAKKRKKTTAFGNLKAPTAPMASPQGQAAAPLPGGNTLPKMN